MQPASGRFSVHPCTSENKSGVKFNLYLWRCPNDGPSRLHTVCFINYIHMILRNWHILTRSKWFLFRAHTRYNFSRYTFGLYSTPFFTEEFPVIFRNNCQYICLKCENKCKRIWCQSIPACS